MAVRRPLPRTSAKRVLRWALLVVVVGVLFGTAPATAQTEPAVSIDPEATIHDGALVEVTATGFDPGALVWFAPCPAEALDPPNPLACVTGNVRTKTAAGDGSATVVLPVPRFIQRPDDGDDWSFTDCADEGACLVAAAELTGGFGVVELATAALVVVAQPGDTIAPNLLVSEVVVEPRHLSGTVDCAAPTMVKLRVSALQGQADHTFGASGNRAMPCDGPTPFVVLLPHRDGRVTAGTIGYTVQARARSGDYRTRVRVSGDTTVGRERPLVDPLALVGTDVEVIDGSVSGRDLDAGVSATVRCNRSTEVHLVASVRQLVRNDALRAIGAERAACDGMTTIQVPVEIEDGVIAAKPGELWITATISGPDALDRAVRAMPTVVPERIRPASIINEPVAGSRIKIGRATDGMVRVLIDCGERSRRPLIAVRAHRQLGRHVEGTIELLRLTPCVGSTLVRVPVPALEPSGRYFIRVDVTAAEWADHQEAGRRA